MLLPQGQHVVVPGRGVADILGQCRRTRRIGLSVLREEAVGDAALIEALEGARVQSAGAQTGQVLIVAPLDDDDDVDSCQSQFAREHQPGSAASDDHDRMLIHDRVPCAATAMSKCITSSRRPSLVYKAMAGSSP